SPPPRTPTPRRVTRSPPTPTRMPTPARPTASRPWTPSAAAPSATTSFWAGTIRIDTKRFGAGGSVAPALRRIATQLPPDPTVSPGSCRRYATQSRDLDALQLWSTGHALAPRAPAPLLVPCSRLVTPAQRSAE